MKDPAELSHFLNHGYLHAHGVLSPDELEQLRAAFKRKWKPGAIKVSQYDLLTESEFIDLIEHPGILGRVETVFGKQTQMLSLDLLYQGPESAAQERSWHRDFTFPGDLPLSINAIVYLDDMTDETGPTRVVPGTHRGSAMPNKCSSEPLPDEVPVYAKAGDVVFINSAIWHSGGRNRGKGERRAIYAYYGWWWLKRYDLDHALPWQAYVNAPARRLQLLGMKMPDCDIHMYEPTGTIALESRPAIAMAKLAPSRSAVRF